MKFYRRCIVLLLLLLAFGFSDAQAQRRYKYKSGRAKSKAYSRYRGSKAFISRARKYSFVGINLNAFNYYGDITPDAGRFRSDVSFTRPGFGIHYGYQFKPNLSFRSELNYGRITGSDEKGEGLGLQERNLSFKNDLLELSAGISYNLFEVISANRRPPLNPYFHISAAVFLSDPQARLTDDSPWEPLRPLGTEGQFIPGSGVDEYSRVNFAIPFGIGLKLRLPNDFDLSFELGGRKLFTDYIDDVSGPSYPDLDALRNTPNGAKAVQFSDRSEGQSYAQNNEVRGSPKAKDFYIVTQFKLSWNMTQSLARGKFR